MLVAMLYHRTTYAVHTTDSACQYRVECEVDEAHEAPTLSPSVQHGNVCECGIYADNTLADNGEGK